jgi:hypothetical protein
MKKLLIVLGVIVVVIVVILGLLRVINKPKDLGVRYTDQDLQKGRATTGVALEKLDSSAAKSLEFSGNKSISGVYTSETITAMINSATYKYYPLTRTQVKINSDGTVETSGNFSIPKAVRWANDLGADKSVTGKAQSYIGYVSPNPSFYLKGTISASNGQINLNITNAKVSVFTAPKNIVDQYQGQLADFVEERIANVPGMEINSATFTNGKLTLDATYPAVEKSVR